MKRDIVRSRRSLQTSPVLSHRVEPAERLAEYIKVTVDGAPNLSPRQSELLGLLLRLDAA